MNSPESSLPDPNHADIVELKRLFASQKAALSDNPNPSLEQRQCWLEQLEQMLVAKRSDISTALQSDFGSHPSVVTDLYETGGVIVRARYFRRQLEQWLAPQSIELSKKLHGAAAAEVVLMPKGVVGNIAPWNFPIECALVMAADMLAAGNRVILKPSLLAPTTAGVVAQAVSEYFDENVLAVATGGDELTTYFPHLPWDHLTYTGSPAVGRIIMRAAAENLVPVTLELGGKNPAVFTADGIDDDLLRIFLESRIMKGGQVCISPDYVLVPRAHWDDWLKRVCRLWSQMYPHYVGHADATSAINDAHYHRVMGYVEEARARGVQVVSLNGDEPDPASRQIPMYVIVEPPADLKCMEEEIFGPVTPLCSYDSLDDVIARLNAGASPLASYIASHDQMAAQKFVEQVRSGGAGVNNFGTQAGHPAIPFGGLGNSGFGCHSGYEGFRNYCHAKGVFRGAADSLVAKMMRLPYGESAQGLVDAIFK